MSYRKNDLQNRTKGEYTQNDIKKAWQSCLPVFICNSEVFLLAAGKVSEVQLEMFPHREGLISCRAALQLLLSLSSCVWERAAQLMSVRCVSGLSLQTPPEPGAHRSSCARGPWSPQTRTVKSQPVLVENVIEVHLCESGTNHCCELFICANESSKLL